MNIRYCFSIIGLLTATAICPLYGEEDGKDMRPIVCIDYRNFHNKTDNPRANFKAFMDRIAHEFVSTGVYRVLNMEDAGKALEEGEKFNVIQGKEGESATPPSPAFLIKLVVTQYGIDKVRSRNPMTGTVKAADMASVEVILTVTDMRDGTTYLSKNLPRQTVSKDTASGLGTVQGGNYGEQALQEACRLVANLTVQEVILCTPFYIMEANGDKIEVDIPRSVAKPGQLFTVYELGKARRSRRTGKVSKSETAIGRIMLTTCGEESAMAKPAGAFTAPVTTDCIVMWTKQEELPQQSAPPPSRKKRAGRPF